MDELKPLTWFGTTDQKKRDDLKIEIEEFLRGMIAPAYRGEK